MNRRNCLLIIGIPIVLIGLLYCYFPPIYTMRMNHAIKSNDKAKVERLLRLGGNINRDNSIAVIDCFGNAPLKNACIQGNIEIIDMLIKHGARVTTDEWTPLILVLANEYPDRYEIVKLLIDNGASLDEKGESAIIALLSWEYDPAMMGMGTYTRKDPKTHQEMYEIFMLLVESGASLEHWEEVKRFQMTYPELILDHVAYQGNVEILSYLIEERNFDINAKLRRGRTALIIAAENSDNDLMKYLLTQGADKSLTNDEGKTAQDIARENGNKEILELLKYKENIGEGFSLRYSTR